MHMLQHGTSHAPTHTHGQSLKAGLHLSFCRGPDTFLTLCVGAPGIHRTPPTKERHGKKESSVAVWLWLSLTSTRPQGDNFFGVFQGCSCASQTCPRLRLLTLVVAGCAVVPARAGVMHGPAHCAPAFRFSRFLCGPSGACCRLCATGFGCHVSGLVRVFGPDVLFLSLLWSATDCSCSVFPCLHGFWPIVAQVVRLSAWVPAPYVACLDHYSGRQYRPAL